MDMLGDVMSDWTQWAWARHHNILSWYVRPLFLLPFCYFAWRSSLTGIVLTFVALITSMAWFPAPERPDSSIAAFLDAEKAYLTAPWTRMHYGFTGLTVASLGALAAAFWQRSFWLGLGIVNAITALKIAWSHAYAAPGAAWAMTVPAVAGAIIVNAVLVTLYRWRRG